MDNGTTVAVTPERCRCDPGDIFQCVYCALHRHQPETGAALTSDGREAGLVAAVRGALECLGTPDGYLPDIGAPKTRALQRAFEAYEPHPSFKGY